MRYRAAVYSPGVCTVMGRVRWNVCDKCVRDELASRGCEKMQTLSTKLRPAFPVNVPLLNLPYVAPP